MYWKKLKTPLNLIKNGTIKNLNFVPNANLNFNNISQKPAITYMENENHNPNRRVQTNLSQFILQVEKTSSCDSDCSHVSDEENTEDRAAINDGSYTEDLSESEEEYDFKADRRKKRRRLKKNSQLQKVNIEKDEVDEVVEPAVTKKPRLSDAAEFRKLYEQPNHDLRPEILTYSDFMNGKDSHGITSKMQKVFDM